VGSFIRFCGLALILQGVRGYEQRSNGVEQVTPKNQTKTNEENTGQKQTKQGCYFISFSGS